MSHLWNAIELGHVGEVLLRLGRLDEAFAALVTSLEGVQGQHRDGTLHMTGVLAEIHILQGRLEEARQRIGELGADDDLRLELRIRRCAQQALLAAASGDDPTPLVRQLESLAASQPEQSEIRVLMAMWRSQIAGRDSQAGA